MSSTDFFENPAKMLETGLGMAGSVAGMFEGNGAATAGDAFSILSGIQNLTSRDPTIGGMGNVFGGVGGMLTRGFGYGNDAAGAVANGIAALGYTGDAITTYDQRGAASAGLHENAHYRARGDADMAVVKAITSGAGLGSYVSMGEAAVNGAGALSGMMFGTDYQFTAGDALGFGERMNDDSRADGSALEEAGVDAVHMASQIVNPLAGLPGMRAATEFGLETAGDLYDGAVDLFGDIAPGADLAGGGGGGGGDEMVFGLMDLDAGDPFGGMGAGDDSALYATGAGTGTVASSGGGAVDAMADYAGGAVDAASDFVNDLF